MTASLQLDQIRVDYRRGRGWVTAVDGVSLQLPAGDIGCLLGPSGCGKTTLLRAIAGFEPLAAGSIRLGEATLSSAGLHLPPEARRVGVMFQEGALFPHLSAAENIAFGLRRLPSTQRRERARALLDLVGLPAHGDRYPHELSGGQQQRIALARALAPQPALLLLDEPFSNLDRATREHLRVEVRRIIKAAGQTAILVTHDAEEGRAFADHIGTMDAGRLLNWQACHRDAAPSSPMTVLG